MEGRACPIGALGQEFLHGLHLESDEIAIVDMETGIEYFDRGVETSIDSILIVVEPSFESLNLVQRINALALEMEIENIGVVLDKMTSDEMVSGLKGELEKKNIDIIGCINHDPEHSEACFLGQPLGEGGASKDIGDIVYKLFKK